jgi:hypothetical protein
MPVDQAVERLLALGLVIAIAAGAVALALWLNRRRTPQHEGLVLGYPPDLFPARDAAGGSALRALAAVQQRLVAVYRRLPAGDAAVPVGDAALWLRVFLLELRRLMDGAYRAAVITAAYGPTDHLDRLVAEVEAIEAQIVDDLTRQLLGGAGAGRTDRLNRRLAALRECAGEFAAIADAPDSGVHR